MGKFKGRNAVACRECHSQKLKCSGGRLFGFVGCVGSEVLITV